MNRTANNVVEELEARIEELEEIKKKEYSHGSRVRTHQGAKAHLMIKGIREAITIVKKHMLTEDDIKIITFPVWNRSGDLLKQRTLNKLRALTKKEARDG